MQRACIKPAVARSRLCSGLSLVGYATNTRQESSDKLSNLLVKEGCQMHAAMQAAWRGCRQLRATSHQGQAKGGVASEGAQLNGPARPQRLHQPPQERALLGRHLVALAPAVLHGRLLPQLPQHLGAAFYAARLSDAVHAAAAGVAAVGMHDGSRGQQGSALSQAHRVLWRVRQ